MIVLKNNDAIITDVIICRVNTEQTVDSAAICLRGRSALGSGYRSIVSKSGLANQKSYFEKSAPQETENARKVGIQAACTHRIIQAHGKSTHGQKLSNI